MKFRKYVASLVVIAVCWAATGCDTRTNRPLPNIPKGPPKNQSAEEDDWLPIDREAVEAANRPKQPDAKAADRRGDAGQLQSSVPQIVEPVVDTAGSVPWLDADGSQLPMDYWEVQYFNARRIGVTHYHVEADKSGIKIRMETNMEIESGQRSLRQSIVIETRERMDGRMERFLEELTSGPLTARTTGLVTTNEIRLDSSSADRNTKKQIAWPAGSWGPMGIHQMLMRQPMAPGEVRLAKVFLPQMHQLADVKLTAEQPEATTSPEGLLENVLPINVQMQLAKEGIRVRMWADSAGRVQKTIWPEGLNLSSFRVSREAAARIKAEDEIESYQGAALAGEFPTSGLHSAAQARYGIASEQPDPHNLFSDQTNQEVRAKPVYEVVVTVSQPSWDAASATGKQLVPSLKELNNSPLLPHDHPAIDRLANRWVGAANDPVAVAKHLLTSVHQNFRVLPFSASLNPVPVVAQSFEGHSVEQAMLLVALLRNRQIPARMASGVRLTQPNGAQQDNVARFEYHAWTEAWLDEHWVPMDPTAGQLTDCGYIKFRETAFEELDPYEPILSVLRALKPLRIKELTTQ